MGETILGTSFVLGPGGKGSNQSVAAAMAGGQVHFITRLGADAFAEIAQATWARAGVHPEVTVDPDSYTGAAYIFIENATGNNAIIVAAGAAGRVSVDDVEAKSDLIASASVFVTQLEQPANVGGRPAEYDWDSFMLEIIRRANTPDGLPDSQAELIREMLQWFTDKFGSEPAESSLKLRTSKIYKYLMTLIRLCAGMVTTLSLTRILKILMQQSIILPQLFLA